MLACRKPKIRPPLQYAELARAYLFCDLFLEYVIHFLARARGVHCGGVEQLRELKVTTARGEDERAPVRVVPGRNPLVSILGTWD